MGLPCRYEKVVPYLIRPEDIYSDIQRLARVINTQENIIVNSWTLREVENELVDEPFVEENISNLDLDGLPVIKGDFIVYVVNEDQYASVGGITPCIICTEDNINSLKEFKKDFSLKRYGIEFSI